MGIFQQFPYTNFHEMNLDEIIKILRNMQDEWAETKTEWASYKDFIDNYFANLDIPQEVLEALQVMAASGELANIMDPMIAADTAAWLAANIGPTTPAIDASLTVAGAGADAKVTGDNFDVTVKFRRYLTNADNCFALPIGVYGVPVAAADKPTNLPADFTASANGFLVVLESQSNVTNLALAFETYLKKMWMYTGYGWVRIADPTLIYEYLYANVITDFLPIANDYYYAGSAIATNTTSEVFLDGFGQVQSVSGYTDWVVTDEIPVNPFTFYCITASARATMHLLYAIYDAAGNVLSYEAADDWNIKSITNKLIYTPPTAAKIRIASVYNTAGASLKYALQTSPDKVWSGKKWACMGDSLTEVNATASMKYHDLISAKTGISVVNLGEGGTGYKKTYAGEECFMNRTNTIPLDSDVVTIFGSGNDYTYPVGDPTDTGTATLCGCINATIQNIFTANPTCNLGIITPAPWQAFDPADDTNWMAEYSAAIVQICKNWGVPCLDLYHCSNLRPWDATSRTATFYNGDGVHPNNAGHALFAPRIEEFVASLLLR